MNHLNEVFANTDVVLDGNQYEKCTFKSCTFVFSGGEGFGLNSNTISPDCRFEFRGAASNTLQLMRGIYSMGDWGRKHILATFQSVAPDLKDLH